MSRQRYTEEFKIEAVKQVMERGHPVAEVAARLGVSGYSLYQWIKRYAKHAEHRQQDDDLQAENQRLKAELKCVSEERDILKNRYGLHPLVGTETRRQPILSLGARGAAVGFLEGDPVKKRGSGGVLDLKVVTPSEVIPVRR